MKVTVSWGRALSVSLPPITSITCWLIGRHFVGGMAWPLMIAGLGGFLCLAAIMIIEHEETSRAALPYRAEQILAKAEARNRNRYAKAQTRRFARLQSGEQYQPDRATDLAMIMKGTHDHSAGDSSTTRKLLYRSEPSPTDLEKCVEGQRPFEAASRAAYRRTE